MYVPITTQDRQSGYEVRIPRTRFLQKGSVANVQGVASLPTIRLARRVGTLPAQVLSDVKKALAWALDLDFTDTPP